MTTDKQLVKKQIRDTVRQRRQSISAADSLKAGNQAAASLQSIKQYQHAKNLAAFLSFDGEMDTQPIIEQILGDNKQCYLPKLKPYQPNRLWFMPFHHQSSMETNRFGIPEVDLPINNAQRISNLDIILLPLVAFDEAGNRLGMGGGFYDATLAHLKSQREKPLCLGIAFELQKVDSVPSEKWDFQIDGVVTEKTTYWF